MARWQSVVLAISFFLSFRLLGKHDGTHWSCFCDFQVSASNKQDQIIFLNNNNSTHLLCILCYCECVYVYESSQHRASFHVHVYFTSHVAIKI